MRNVVCQVGLILAVSTTVFFTNLGQPRLWDVDEPRNAGCATEMLHRNDWVVPIFNGELRRHKPPLLYWVTMLSYRVLGQTEFSARLGSAALGVLTCLATYVIGWRLFDSRIGTWAAIALSTSMMFAMAARAATPDSVLVFCSTASLMLFVIGAFPRPIVTDGSAMSTEPPHERWHWFPQNRVVVVCMYLAMGLGVLAKGPIGFLLPMAMIGMYGLLTSLPDRQQSAIGASTMRRFSFGFWQLIRAFSPLHFVKTLREMKPLWAAGLILFVSLPWFVMVHIKTEGDFTWLFFVEENLKRATEVKENHSGGVWYYPALILVGFFPWSCLWGPTVIGLFWPSNINTGGTAGTDRHAAAHRFLLCWICIQVGAFTIAKTKLPSYVTPCYPALALLVANCLGDLVSKCQTPNVPTRVVPYRVVPYRVRPVWFYLAFAGLGIGGCLIAGGLFFGSDIALALIDAPTTTAGRATSIQTLMPTFRWLAAIGVVVVLAAAALIVQLRHQRTRWMLPVYACTGFVAVFGTFAIGATWVDQHRDCMAILNVAKQRSGQLATYGCDEPSWVYYAEKQITELHLEPTADSTVIVPTGFRLPARKFWQEVPTLTVSQYVSAHDQAMIITTDEHVEYLLRRLPDFHPIADADYFLKNKRLRLIGRRNQPPAELN